MASLADLRKEIQAARRKLTTIARLLAEYERAQRARRDPFALERLLQQLEKQGRDAPLGPETRERLRRWLEYERTLLREQRRTYQVQFVQELQAKLRPLGFSLEGHLPRLYAGLYQILPSFEQGTVKITWGPEPVASLKGLDPGRVAQAIQKHEKALKRPFVAEEFFRLLQQAYRRARQEAGPDRRVPLALVHRHLTLLLQPRTFWQNPVRTRFREYPRSFFAYDLYRLRQSSLGDRVRLYVATFDQTRDPSQALFVPDSAQRGTRYAYLSLEPEEA